MHDFQRRGVDRVAAEIAQEVGVLLQDQHVTPARANSSPSIIPAGPPPDTALHRYSANWAARQRNAAPSPSLSRISSNFTPTSVRAA